MVKVRRRLAIYISGFDPRGAAHYHKLYATEAARQGVVSGMTIEVGPRRRVSPLASQWRIEARDEGGAVTVDYQFLHWDDLVRAHWARGAWPQVRDIAGSFAAIVASGHLRRVYRLSWPFAVTASLPFGVLAASVLAVLAASVLAALAGWLALPSAAWIFVAAGLTVGVALAAAVLRFGERHNAFWLGRLIAFTVECGRGRVPEIDARCQQFAAHVGEQAAREPYDEVLVVGHSLGSEVAVKTLARMLAQHPDLARDGRLAFLTLAHTIPWLGLLPGAAGFRGDLLRVATAPGLTWIDFGAPPDPACFALLDPVAGCELTRPAGAAVIPKLLSPRFFRLLSERTYARLARRKMDMHFMYLLAMEKLGPYDFFAITAGSRRLGDRFAEHKSNTAFDRLRGGQA